MLELRPTGTKKCSKCKQFKPLERFHKRPERKVGRESRCIECKKNADASRWIKNRDTQKKLDIKRRYGISFEDYEAMYQAQNGVCAICKKPEKRIHQNGTPSQLCIDHCHTTDAVRGLLCDECNRALALVHENPEITTSLLQYINEKCLW